MISFLTKNGSMTQLRVRLYIPKSYWQEPIISQIISRFNLTVNITGAQLEKNTNLPGCFDLELRGYMSQIQESLNYLETLNIKIVGKPNTDGDSWYC
ncbi:MAG: NIL domain-containing protein [Aulosira sp. ZfuCHP01]|nr:NIL domain-containing protein [Aulosira sp. DedVER01a]MDZ8055436.1 NIL domain-containing protein [Aulosira sp. ZfuCHP01]